MINAAGFEACVAACPACAYSPRAPSDFQNPRDQENKYSEQLFPTAFSTRGFSILRCPHCRLMWTDVPPGFDSDQIYTKEYFEGGLPDGYFDYLGSEKLLMHEFLSRTQLIRSWVSGGRLLEIGCATGGFLTQARRHFTVQGIDLSAFAIEQALRKGLDVDLGSLEESSIIKAPYDVVVLFDTIEHLPNPVGTLQRVHSILATGAFLFLTTGDTGSLLARISGKHWRLMTPPQHLWFFSAANMTLLLQRLGYSVIAIRYLWRLVPMSLIWYQLFRGKAKQLPSPIARTALPINLYDTMTVIARKC
jgi:SAM-dependent methyltransferase